MAKTSAGKILQGFDWTYEGPISMLSGDGFQGVGKSRTLILKPKLENIDQIPEELFSVKISQSPNKDKNGKAVFRFITFKTSQDEQSFSDIAPNGIAMDTPLSEIKKVIVTTLQGLEGAEVSVMVPLHGTFTIANLADGNYDVYNEEKFPSDVKMELGEPPYYIRPDAEMTVKLTGSENMGNEYLRSRIGSKLTADEVFQRRAEGKVWGEDESTGASAPVEESGDIW